MSRGDEHITRAARAIEEAMSQPNWMLRAAASTVGIERKMSTNEVVAHYLASKALAAAEAVGDDTPPSDPDAIQARLKTIEKERHRLTMLVCATCGHCWWQHNPYESHTCISLLTPDGEYANSRCSCSRFAAREST